MKAIRLTLGEKEHAKTLFKLMADVFEEKHEELNDEYVNRLLSLESFWVLAAFIDDKIVGGLTAHTLPMSNREASEIFIYDIAIDSKHQRKGVGRYLIKQLRQEADEIGIEDIFVPADNEDIHALDFYRAIGGEASPVTIFTFGKTIP